MTQHRTRQYSDQLFCHVCGKQWDVNDIDPPECKPTLEPVKIGDVVECRAGGQYTVARVVPSLIGEPRLRGHRRLRSKGWSKKEVDIPSGWELAPCR